MKKRPFWLMMVAVSLLNGAIFYRASSIEMNRGIEGVDNQAGLLFIPILWVMAIYALAVLHVYTLIHGRKLANNQEISLLDLFRLSELSAKSKMIRVIFLITVCLLMVFGYSLFAAEKIWAVSYALSGGILLLLLYAWEKACDQNGRTAN